MQNIGGFFEIPTKDINRAITFYGAVFNCQFSRQQIHGNEMAFFPVDLSDSGISGALAMGSSYIPSKNGTLIYLNTSNIDATIEEVLKHGGKLLFPKTSAGAYGFVAEFEDCEGNRLALFEQMVTLS